MNLIKKVRLFIKLLPAYLRFRFVVIKGIAGMKIKFLYRRLIVKLIGVKWFLIKAGLMLGLVETNKKK